MTPSENQLIAMLPRADRLRLLGVCETVPLVLSEVLTLRGEATHHVYFPVDGFISLVSQVDDHPGLEVGMVGSEGMLGAQVALGVLIEPLRALVQGAGLAHRMPATVFALELAHSAALRHCMGRYLHTLVEQLACSAACQRFHAIAPRLARWLLMSQDRAHCAHFHVTHLFLAYMLGVRRVGVTQAAGGLQRAGLISYHRGELSVLDRAGLEDVACSCYAADCAAYARNLVKPTARLA